MSGMSAVSMLIAQHTSDLEKAREIFTAESRAFVSSILGGIRRARAEPWVSGRVRVDIPRDIDTEARATAYLREVFALARADLRFKKGTNFTVVAEVKFGIEFDDDADAFAWQVMLVPSSRYQRIDDRIWPQWCTARGSQMPPGSIHQDRSNTVRFVSRALNDTLTADSAFNDVKGALDFLLTTDAALADAIGVDEEDS